MKLKPEIKKSMEDKSTDYIDWDELYYGDKEKSGTSEAAAFCDGFKYAISVLSFNGHIKGDYTDNQYAVELANIKEALLCKKIYTGNPSALEKYSEEGSEHLRDLLKLIKEL